MNVETAPATVGICCRLPARIMATELADWVQLAHRSAAAITWVAGVDNLHTLGSVLSDQSGTTRIAVEADEVLLGSRQALRRTIAAVRQECGQLDAVVAAGGPAVPHRSLLVDEGIRALCVDRFEQVSRGSRRPAPHGWPCRSLLWGLWEVAGAAKPTFGPLGRVLHWRALRPLAPGTLSVLHVTATTDGASRTIRSRLERVLGLVTRRRARAPVNVIHLADLPDLLVGGDAARTGSVLKAA